MDFELSSEQQMLRDNVARLMKDRYGFEARKTYQADPARLQRKALARIRRHGPPRRAVRRGGRRLRRRRGRDDDRDGGIRQGARARTLSRNGRSRRRADQARRAGGKTRRTDRQDRGGRLAPELRPCRKAGRASTSTTSGSPRARTARPTCSTARRGSSSTATAPTRSSSRPGSRAAGATATGSGCSSSTPTRRGVTRRGYPTQDGRRAAEIGFAKVRVEPENVLGPPEGGSADHRARGRRDDRRAVGRGGRRDERSARDDRRIPEDAQAVRRHDRLVPGASASRLRHGRRARAGAQHDVSGHHERGRGQRRRSAPRRSRPPRSRSGDRQDSSGSRPFRCTAGSR